MQLYADGRTRAHICHIMFITRHTVRNHTLHARAKLGVCSTMAAGCEALRRGLIR